MSTRWLPGRPMQDGVWVDLVAQAQALNHLYADESLKVHAVRRWRIWGVREGLAAVDYWTDVFEPARVRWVGARGWRDVATVEQVTARIKGFLEDRPDLH